MSGRTHAVAVPNASCSVRTDDRPAPFLLRQARRVDADDTSHLQSNSGKCQPTTTASSRRGVGRKREGKQGAHAKQWDTRPVRQFSERLGYPIRIWMHAIVNPALAEREIIIVPWDTSRPLRVIWRTASAIPDA